MSKMSAFSIWFSFRNYEFAKKLILCPIFSVTERCRCFCCCWWWCFYYFYSCSYGRCWVLVLPLIRLTWYNLSDWISIHRRVYTYNFKELRFKFHVIWNEGTETTTKTMCNNSCSLLGTFLLAIWNKCFDFSAF